MFHSLFLSRSLFLLFASFLVSLHSLAFFFLLLLSSSSSCGNGNDHNNANDPFLFHLSVFVNRRKFVHLLFHRAIIYRSLCVCVCVFFVVIVVSLCFLLTLPVSPFNFNRQSLKSVFWFSSLMNNMLRSDARFSRAFFF